MGQIRSWHNLVMLLFRYIYFKDFKSFALKKNNSGEALSHLHSLRKLALAPLQ